MERFPQRLNQPPDLEQDFLDPASYLFVAQEVESFDAATGQGNLVWQRQRRKPRVAFSHMTYPLEAVESWEFPPVFGEPKHLPFALNFISPRCVRLRFKTRPGPWQQEPSLMLAKQDLPRSNEWKPEQTQEAWTWRGPFGSLRLGKKPWFIELVDAQGKIVLRSHSLPDSRCMISGRPLPFCYARRSNDLTQRIAASFHLYPDEKIYGCGESFTRLNKRGQAIDLWTQDAHGSQSEEMYKPVPFYLSSRGYGIFVHSSTPMRFDFGKNYADTQTLYCGDESLDLFIFLGDAKQVLSEYTALSGRSPRPPLWSFGLWMSRITYESEAQTREVAAKLRQHRIPCDVIHLDTGWFETDWCCDYRFAPQRFADPAKMIQDLKRDGFQICLWQLPYFTPKNRLYAELLEKGLVVKGEGGEATAEEVVLDFSNPQTVAWYQNHLESLLKLGVGCIKVDFGEAAPLHGRYHSGHSGWQEHNLYPLRYNAAAAEISRQVRGSDLIWARSAWAGSQRYPLHWGGDAEASDGGMLGSLRGGLSLGLCGFSYWSHDVGGFFPATPRDLYLRWLPFGLLSSHSRCHGLPPTEPWEFDAEFLEIFRQCVELRYRLLPYIWAQATLASQAGHPLIRPLFFEFPQDRTSWEIEDQYMFGTDILVAPLFEEGRQRQVYLPEGAWVDLQSGEKLEGGIWKQLKAGPIPAIILGRSGALIPTTQPAAHTGALDWSKIECLVLGPQGQPSQGFFCGPQEAQAQVLDLSWQGEQPKIKNDPAHGKVEWSFKRIGS